MITWILKNLMKLIPRSGALLLLFCHARTLELYPSSNAYFRIDNGYHARLFARGVKNFGIWIITYYLYLQTPYFGLP